MYVLHSEQNLFQKEAVVLFSAFGKFKTKIKIKFNLPYIIYIYGPEFYMANPNIYSGSGHLPDFWSKFTLLAGQIFSHF